FSLALSSSASEYLKAQLAVIIPLQTFITFALLMLLISQPKIKTLYQRSGSYIDMISGGLFLLFALWLWYDALILRSEEHTSELQSRENLVCRLLLEKKKYVGGWHLFRS